MLAATAMPGNGSDRNTSSGSDWYRTGSPYTRASPQASRSPVMCSPAIPRVIPLYSSPPRNTPYAHRPMSSAAMPGSRASPNGIATVSTPSGPGCGAARPETQASQWKGVSRFVVGTPASAKRASPSDFASHCGTLNRPCSVGIRSSSSG